MSMRKGQQVAKTGPRLTDRLAPEEAAQIRGLTLAEYREELGWTHSRMARELGVDRATIYRWEAGTAPIMAELAVAELWRRHRTLRLADESPPERKRAGNPNWRRSA